MASILKGFFVWGGGWYSSKNLDKRNKKKFLKNYENPNSYPLLHKTWTSISQLISPFLFHFYMLQKGWGNSMLIYFLQYYSYSLKDQQLKFQWIYAAIFCIPCLSSNVFLIWKKKLILLYFILPTHNKISVRSFLYRPTA